MKLSAKNLLIIGIVLFIALPVGWSEEFNYQSYAKATFQNIVTEEQNHTFDQTGAKQNAVTMQLECRVTKYKVLCRYSSFRRPISDKKKNVIQSWLETLGIDPNFASLYRQEIQVTEGMNVHWIPVQEKLLSHINRELVKDDMIDIFIIFTGKVGSEFVFIATEYEKSLSLEKKLIKATAYERAVP